MNKSKQIRDRLPTPNRVMAPVWWYGGKGQLANKIIPYIPAGYPYVEPYCGAASIFWHLDPPRKVEVLNDLYGEIINLFRVLQDHERFDELAHRLTWTPYSLAEFRKALEINIENSDPITAAWAAFVRQNQGFSGKAKTEGSWSKAITNSNRGMAGTSSKWRSRLSMLDAWHERLSRVQLDSRDALDVIKYWDTDNTVFYLDPPYVASTRKSNNIYDCEADETHHEKLIDLLLELKGRAVLSGYDSPLYSRLMDAGWERVEFKTVCHAAGKIRGSRLQGEGAARKHVSRTEVLWIKRR